MRDMRLRFKLAATAITSRSTRDFYDRISPFYDLLFTDHLTHVRKMAAVLKEQLADKDQIKILDLACGTGALSRQLEEQGFSTTGVDFSFHSLSQLNKKSKTIRVVQADATTLPFGSASFDVITCMGAWRHFPCPQRVLEEICRVLRDSGIFLVGYFPPKLGGLVSVPKGEFGKVIRVLYRSLIQLLKYNDKVDEQAERETLRMIESDFVKHQIIRSGKNEYLILARSPRR